MPLFLLPVSRRSSVFFFLMDPAPPESSPLPLPDALPISRTPPPTARATARSRLRRAPGVPEVNRATDCPGRPPSPVPLGSNRAVVLAHGGESERAPPLDRKSVV